MIDDASIVIEIGLAELARRRLDPRPFDREPVGVQPDPAREREVLAEESTAAELSDQAYVRYEAGDYLEAVVLYMKGTPQFPQCGFSAVTVQILRACGVSSFLSVNVLENPEIRSGIKEYANWPTIPQLYVRGEFVGGCDIMREMYQSGELKQLLAGIAAPD